MCSLPDLCKMGRVTEANASGQALWLRVWESAGGAYGREEVLPIIFLKVEVSQPPMDSFSS